MDSRVNNFLDNTNFDSRNSLIHLLDDNDDEGDEYTPNIINHSLYCSNTELLNNINTIHGITILTLNCQSLSAKFDILCIFLKSMQCKIDVICLQETWCDNIDQYKTYKIDNYNYVASCCTASRHGGLITYIHDDLIYKSKEYGTHSDIWESHFIEISNNISKKSYLVGNVKRSFFDFGGRYVHQNQKMNPSQNL